ncbi:acriflavin resistance protein, partial [mine drainage metagenome]
FGGVLLKPWNERTRTATQLQQILQRRWNHIAGARVVAFQFPSLPGSQGLPVQFEITTAEPIANLNAVARQVLARARASGLFFFVDDELKIDQPQDELVVNPNKVADLGLTQQDVASTLGAALGGGYVNYFELGGRSYQVMPQVRQRFRLNSQPDPGLSPAHGLRSHRGARHGGAP